jgi:serine/threonine protein kinase
MNVQVLFYKNQTFPRFFIHDIYDPGLVICRLEYMHSKGIAYRDLKPENTLIGENGYPKLIDMGFAKRIHNRRTFSMCGTPDYMAPEIIKRQGHGKGVDFWALGCMIFEMITNTSPFNRGDDPPQVNIVSTKYWAFVRE